MGSTTGRCPQPASQCRSLLLPVVCALLPMAALLAGGGEAQAKRITIVASQSALLVYIASNLHVSLPQGLLFVLEQQAEWRVRRKPTNAAAMPNYLDFVATDPSREIRESSVGIVK